MNNGALVNIDLKGGGGAAARRRFIRVQLDLVYKTISKAVDRAQPRGMVRV